MNIETALHDFLAGLPSLGGQKAYYVFAHDEAEAPYMTIRRLKTAREYDMDGPSGLCEPVFRITCWAATYMAAKASADAIREALSVRRSQLPIAGIDRAEVIDELDSFEPSPELLTKQLFGRTLDVLITAGE